jgi:hypothetical protein
MPSAGLDKGRKKALSDDICNASSKSDSGDIGSEDEVSGYVRDV